MRHVPSHYRILAIMLCALITGNFPVAAAATPRATRAVRPAHAAIRHRAISRYGVPTFADSSKDDVTTNDDPVVREAAVEALGRYNGSVVAIDPSTGRLLSVVNQKLAFSAGFIPCSTIKPVIAVAALQEGVVTRDTMIRVAPRKYLNLTEALGDANHREIGRAHV